MTPVLSAEVESSALERIRADVLVVGVAPEDRPLRGPAGHADWRLCGRLSELIASDRFSGRRGEVSLVVASMGLPCRLVLVVGLGPRRSLDLRVWQEVGRDVVDRALGLCARDIGLGVLDDRCSQDALTDALAGLIAGASCALRDRSLDARVLLLGAEAQLGGVLCATLFSAASAPRLAPGVELRLPPPAPSPGSRAPQVGPPAF